jgi:hypothetical protein
MKKLRRLHAKTLPMPPRQTIESAGETSPNSYCDRLPSTCAMISNVWNQLPGSPLSVATTEYRASRPNGLMKGRRVRLSHRMMGLSRAPTADG